MTTRFHGCLLLVLFVVFVEPSTSSRLERGAINPLISLSTSRDQLVEIAGYGEERLSSVLVIGSVSCEACSKGDQNKSHEVPISGATVVVHCKTGIHRKQPKQRRAAQGKTDEYGDFIIDLPSHLHATPNLDKACTVRVLKLPHRNSHCKHVLLGKPSEIELSSFGNNIRTYTTGNLKFTTPKCMIKKRSGHTNN
ncbi:hypothetical protein Syun_026772 [Stephania yunnanensis]|uniref:Pollen Ole e 1 allergen and extensin family protein n=1 Tax=Stephania yunnanensis TaxID=152371 RepID=A0AAP0HPJ7_9MAGN